MSAIEPEKATRTLADLVCDAGGPDLKALLEAIRPEYGAVGSRDEDVSRRRRDIDATLELLAGPVQSSWTPVAEAMPESGEPLWLHTTYGKVIAGSKQWRQGWNPDYWETESGELNIGDVMHWMPRRRPAPPVVTDTQRSTR